MLNRQDMRKTGKIAPRMGFVLSILFLAACRAAAISESTPEPLPPTPSVAASTPVGATLQPTKDGVVPTSVPTEEPRCLQTKGRIERRYIESAELPGQLYFSVYLPPCYNGSSSYPVLYLLHGITYSDDQWIRLGAVETADAYITAGLTPPFIMIFPYNPNPKRPPESHFGEALAGELLPYIDEHYATCGESSCRMIGGLSRGGGWAWDIFLDHPDLFSAVGGHSPALFQHVPSLLAHRLQGIWTGQRLWLDVGEQDMEVHFLAQVDDALTQAGIDHRFTVSPGTHGEEYWQANIPDYLLWYFSVYSVP